MSSTITTRCFAALLAVSTAAGASAASMRVRVVDGPTVQRTEQSVRVSNIHRIVVAVAVDGAGESLAPLSLGSSGAAGTLTVSASTLSPSGGSADVSLKAYLVSASIDEGALRAVLEIELPLPASQRDEEIRAFIEEVRSNASEEERKQLQARDASIQRAMQQIFIENRIGTFELRVHYASTGGEYWHGTLDATTRFEVGSDGTFIDALKKSKAPHAPQ
jgi:hypothetical protein